MKTPKEILLQRHEGMESKLDAARRRAVASLQPEPSWREWLQSLRWQLAGMGAIWLAVLVLHAASTVDSTVVFARGKAPPARAFMAALVQNRRTLQEMTETPLPAEPATMPPRRSEIQPVMEVV